MRRLTVILGLAQTLAYATTYYIPAVVTAEAAATFGASPTALLGGFSLALLVSGLASPFVGRRIDRVGGRGALASGAAVMALGLALLGIAPNLTGWYAGWLVAGVGMALGLYDAAFATLGRLYGASARRAIVGVTLMAGFASTVAWPVGVALVQAVGWRATALIYAAVHLLGLAPLILWSVPRQVPDAPPLRSPAEDAEAPGPPQAGFALLAIFFSLRSALTAVFSVHALAMLTGAGLSTRAAVATAALVGPSQVFARLAEFAAGRRLTPMGSALIGAGLLPLGAAALLLGAPPQLFAVGYGMSNGVLTISRGTLPLFLFGARGYAARLGRLALPQMAAQAAAPTLAAPLIAAWPAERMFWLFALTSSAALLCLMPLRADTRVKGSARARG